MEHRHVPPDITKTAFACPHCGVLTTQHRFILFAKFLDKETSPIEYSQNDLDGFDDDELSEDPELDRKLKARLRKFTQRILNGTIVVQKRSNEWASSDERVVNLSIAECYDCREFSVWVRDKLVHPPIRTGVAPNADLPDDIKKDFEEARSVLDRSPRAAAALLRLCIQKLCIELGEDGKKIRDDIGSLVAKGLDERIQKALDVVRVNGNRAVHPSEMDDEDRRETAIELFPLVNLIADQMISKPKRVDEMYGRLPEAALASIERRDSK